MSQFEAKQLADCSCRFHQRFPEFSQMKSREAYVPPGIFVWMTNKEGFSCRVIPTERKRRGILARLTALCAFLTANKIPHITFGMTNKEGFSYRVIPTERSDEGS